LVRNVIVNQTFYTASAIWNGDKAVASIGKDVTPDFGGNPILRRFFADISPWLQITARLSGKVNRIQRIRSARLVAIAGTHSCPSPPLSFPLTRTFVNPRYPVN
jgi:hypothetical protein